MENITMKLAAIVILAIVVIVALLRKGEVRAGIKAPFIEFFLETRDRVSVAASSDPPKQLK